MARMTVTLGELTTEVSDWSPWLTRFRLRAWEKTAHRLIDRVTQEIGELVTTTELAAQDEEDECDEDFECSSRPSLGYNSRVGGK